eukprot:m.81594 g.81594  ORF g.81594 m.81594 type:complete len:281 (+) comp12646_c0_seq1:261-1103(+)
MVITTADAATTRTQHEQQDLASTAKMAETSTNTFVSSPTRVRTQQQQQFPHEKGDKRADFVTISMHDGSDSNNNVARGSNTVGGGAVSQGGESDDESVFAPQVTLVSHNEHLQSKDPFRDTWVRFLGYTNELGEAFKHVLPRPMYFLTYGVASVYAASDAAHKGSIHYNMASSSKVPYSPPAAALGAVVDTAFWQGLASVAIPGFAINRVVALTRFIVAATGVAAAVPTLAWLPTAVGIATIPLIIKPIDSFVDAVLDHTLRPALQTHLRETDETKQQKD